MDWGTAIGGFASGLFGYKGTKDQNVASAAQAQKQMDFQERMSNTAIQRRMADLRKGGLNPILAGKHDASSPAGAMAPMHNKAAVALQNASTAANVKNISAQTQLVNNQARTQFALGTTAQAAALPAELILEIANKIKAEKNKSSKKTEDIYQPPIDAKNQLDFSEPQIPNDTSAKSTYDNKKQLEYLMRNDADFVRIIKQVFKDTPLSRFSN
jgi:hypothetical protein